MQAPALMGVNVDCSMREPILKNCEWEHKGGQHMGGGKHQWEAGDNLTHQSGGEGSPTHEIAWVTGNR